MRSPLERLELLMVVARGDHVAVADEALAASERALQPKQLVIVPGAHFDAYIEGFKITGNRARDGFVEHLISVGDR